MTGPRRARYAAAGCAVLFLLLAAWVAGSRPPRIDRVAETSVHVWMLAHPPWPRIARIAGWILSPTSFRLVVLVVAAALLASRTWRGAAIWLLATVTLAGLLSDLLKQVFSRPRPDWPDPIQLAGGFSFPSGHALTSATAAGCAIALLGLIDQARPARRRRLRAAQIALLILPLAAGLDRVLLGVHYVSDVIAGWVMGACIVLAMWGLARPSKLKGGDQRINR